MTIPPKVEALIGFAKKSGKLLAGEAAVESGMKRGAVQLVLIAEDLPEKRKTHWQRWCREKNVKIFSAGKKEEFGRLLGMSPRGILGCGDKQLALAIIRQLEPSGEL